MGVWDMVAREAFSRGRMGARIAALMGLIQKHVAGDLVLCIS